MSKPVESINPLEQLQATEVEHWQLLFQNIRDPLVAGVLVDTFENDSSLKKQFAAAYSLARVTLVRDTARGLRAARNRYRLAAWLAFIRTHVVKAFTTKQPLKEAGDSSDHGDDRLVWPPLNHA